MKFKINRNPPKYEILRNSLAFKEVKPAEFNTLLRNSKQKLEIKIRHSKSI